MMVAFKMIKINVDQFAILVEEPIKGEISLNISISFQYSAEGKRIACIVDTKFEKDAVTFMLLKMNCEFIVPAEDWERYSNGESFEIPIELQKLLAAQVVGVARGVLFCKTEGTPFNNIILPSINVSQIIDKGQKN